MYQGHCEMRGSPRKARHLGEMIDAALTIAPEPKLPGIRPVLLAPWPDRQLDLFEKPAQNADPGTQLSFFVA